MQALRRRLSPRQIDYWMAFYHLEPFGGLQEDTRAIATALLVLNAFREKGTPQTKIGDLFPHLDLPPDPRQIVEALPNQRQLSNQLAALAQAWGAKIVPAEPAEPGPPGGTHEGPKTQTV